MKIPIKKHTKVRRPVSRWHIRLVDGERYIHYFTKDRYEALYQDAFHKPITILVQDISKGLQNPLILLPGMYTNWQKVQKGNWNEWHKEMNEQFKPSLWQRIKRKF